MTMTTDALAKRPVLVIFDIDGTLLETAGIHHDLITGILAKDGLDVLFQPWASYRHYTDRGVLDELIRHTLGRPMQSADLERYDEAFGLALVAHTENSPIAEIAGAKRLIGDLAGMPGVRMCFATGSMRKMAVVKLGLLGIDGNAVALATGSDYLSREEIVQAAIEQACGDLDGAFDVVILGDGAWDERTAANLAIPFVAVQSGLHIFGDGPLLTVRDFTALDAETLVALALPYRHQAPTDRRAENTRQTISTGSAYEKELGYSRAVRVGDTVHVSGCSGLLRTPGAGPGTAEAQFLVAAGKLEQTLQKAGATLGDVVRTRVYLTRAEDWETVGRAHGKIFGDIQPASSMLQVVRLIDTEMLIELEATAIIGSRR